MPEDENSGFRVLRDPSESGSSTRANVSLTPTTAIIALGMICVTIVAVCYIGAMLVGGWI